jgi:hypothetical protein
MKQRQAEVERREQEHAKLSKQTSDNNGGLRVRIFNGFLLLFSHLF